MKIQDMRPGMLHLNKTVEPDEAAVSVAEPESAEAIRSEVDAPIWSVVSFDNREAGGMTYHQAAELLDFLEGRGVNGLCIITDAAAERYAKGKPA